MDESKVFSDVKFVIAECNNSETLKNILIEGGAKHINYLSEHVTIVVADTKCPEAEEAIELFDKPVVSSRWVHLSLRAKKLMPFEAFSPIRSIFHHVAASFSKDLSKNDVEILAATLTFYGARVCKNIAHSTHFIVAKADPTDMPSESSTLKIVAPDWVFDSVKQKICCDELLYDPSLLLPPKPPTPSPPPQPIQQNDKPESDSSEKDSNFRNQQSKIEQSPQQIQIQIQPKPRSQSSTQVDHGQAQIQHQQQLTQKQHHKSQPQMQSQPTFQAQQVQTLPSQVPRPRMQANVIRGMQHKFRPILPPNNVSMHPRTMVQATRNMVPDGHQGRKVTINIDHRKPGPYQNNMDSQQLVPLHQQNLYATNQHVQVQTQPTQPVAGVAQPSNRLSQPNIYHQARPGYQNNHMQPRSQSHQINMNQQQQHQLQPQQQPPPMINRFQDPNIQQNQRPYQVNLQPQPVNPNYSSGNMHRQQIYYTQNSNQVQMRMPQQPSTGIRHSQGEQAVYDNFNPPPPVPLAQSPRQHLQHSHAHEIQHYQVPQPQQTFHQQQQHLQPQPIPQQPHQQLQPQSQHPQRPQISPPSLISSPGPPIQPVLPSPVQNAYQAGSARVLFNNQQEVRANSVRPPRMTGHQVRGPIMPIHNQPSIQTQQQPHPSIFDPTQESNLAQIKAKVPIVTENIDYFGHDLKESVPKDLPLHSCSFKLIDYEDVHLKLKAKWCSAIKAAGGTVTESLHDATIMICENRLSPLYPEAIKLGIRCVTIYWLNDVLAQKRLSYPWKALHLPVPFSKLNRPLVDHTITITNLNNRERREVKDMILKAGAKYTDYFSLKNSLIICGNVGGDKYERAVEWKVPIANCRILSDILLSNSDCNLDLMLNQTKYQLFNRGDPLKLTTYADVKELMNPWTKPIPINERKEAENSAILMNGATKGSNNALNSNEDSGIATSGSTNNDLEVSSVAKPGELDDTAMLAIGNIDSAITDDSNKPSEVATSQEIVRTVKKMRKSNDPIRILFTHLESSLVDRLTKYAADLGLAFANGPTNCTHLIVDKISRTHKFICAFSHATYILSHKWLIESHEAKNLLDENQFILQDEIGESKFSFKLAYSLMKRKKYGRLIFDGFIFFVTPSVLAAVSNLKEMIESAGAMITTRKLPTKLQLIDMRAEKKRFVVVTCNQDLDLLSHLDVTIPRVGVEFILSGILRQDIDFEAHQIGDTNITKKARLME